MSSEDIAELNKMQADSVPRKLINVASLPAPTFRFLLSCLEARLALLKPDVIVGLEARGFLFGPSLALSLNCAFVPIRKGGKLPGKCLQSIYQKEYGEDIFEIQEHSIKPGQRVIIVDDILATGMEKQPTD
ncbi:Adenine phosphoribosyltransferase [Neolecta irregularis DAH-3]|uniref:adenine phosphoribosyltransferase n=1 Tax=Neolecta irregularis (strain DAH-3) TaxID=1198029 RepID=A0A1U7LN14_NEOID|nr:Adenine phosphoribosyltransferase [Neolecta irregularis DAH-3]|eukprot:OLL24045.1 Adenine phosphoribosyltransferase [Neolecta irregularis DAH-3]